MEKRLWKFPRPADYDLRSALRCLSMSRRDPSRQSLPEGGARKLIWLRDHLCRLTIGGNEREVRASLEGPQEALAPIDDLAIEWILGLPDTQHKIILPPTDPLALIPRLVRNSRLGRVFWLVEPIAQTVLHQRVSGAEASLNWQRLCRRHGKEWDGLVSAPSRETLLRLSSADFAACGIEHKRAVPIKEAAFRFQSLLEPGTSPADVGASLLTIRGLGPWTESFVRGHFLGDPDVVPLGDYDLPRLVCYFFRGHREGNDEEMLEVLEPYRGYRFRVLRWLEVARVSVPRRGARLPLGTL